jgi:hypothetical protein
VRIRLGRAKTPAKRLLPSNRDSHAAQRAGSQWRMPQNLWLRLIVLHKPVTARRLGFLPSQLPMHLPTGSLRQLLAYD